jgi:hypothetical protein
LYHFIKPQGASGGGSEVGITWTKPGAERSAHTQGLQSLQQQEHGASGVTVSIDKHF